MKGHICLSVSGHVLSKLRGSAVRSVNYISVTSIPDLHLKLHLPRHAVQGGGPIVRTRAWCDARLGPLQRHDGSDLAGPAHVVKFIRRLERVWSHGPTGGRVHGVVSPDDGVPHPGRPPVHLVADGGDLAVPGCGGRAEVTG